MAAAIMAIMGTSWLKPDIARENLQMNVRKITESFSFTYVLSL
jgi:hypothetical protein